MESPVLGTVTHTKAAKDKADYQKRLAVYMQSATLKTWEAEREAVRKAVEEVDSKFVAAPSHPGTSVGSRLALPVYRFVPQWEASVRCQADPNMPKRPKSAYNIFTQTSAPVCYVRTRGAYSTRSKRFWHPVEKLSTAQRNKYEAQAKRLEGHQAAPRVPRQCNMEEKQRSCIGEPSARAMPRGLASVDTQSSSHRPSHQ